MRTIKRFVNARSVAATMTLLGASAARASLTITPISPGDVPVSNPASPFDVSNTGNTYSLGPNTNLNPGFDIRDLFGGSFGTYGYESNDLLFADNQPIGTVDTVNVTLAAPVSLGSFNLFMADDGISGDRSASEFLLYSGSTLIDDVNILDTSGTQSYTSVYGGNFIEISDSFADLPASSDYTLEFVQNEDPGGTSGVRALDFQGSAALQTPSALASVPEPTSLIALVIGGVALLGRPRRRREAVAG